MTTLEKSIKRVQCEKENKYTKIRVVVAFAQQCEWTFLSYLGLLLKLSVMETKMSPTLCVMPMG